MQSNSAQYSEYAVIPNTNSLHLPSSEEVGDEAKVGDKAEVGGKSKKTKQKRRITMKRIRRKTKTFRNYYKK
jgi:hypothetical protein